jgi:tetratricopeptide (TPR) repeat protein
MSSRSDERSFETLRRRAERAIDEGRGRRVLEPLLERILKLAPEGHPCRVFAHRHLAELRLEDDPWAAALHLRKVVAANPLDDVSHSLMALAQALLGNYRSAVSSYRKALSLSPRNPWYHHNLGHLLDVALDDPKRALPHLEVALEGAEPPEHEITASVAHCLARLGKLDRARKLAEQALSSAPSSEDHRALVAWIDKGAPRGVPIGANVRPVGCASPQELDPVLDLLAEHLRAEGFSPRQLERARALYRDYLDVRVPAVRKPEIVAAAVHYAISVVFHAGTTHSALARRYGCAPKSVAQRYALIRDALDLVPNDPRYA